MPPKTTMSSEAAPKWSGTLSKGFAARGEGLRGHHYRLLTALEEWGPSSQADLARSTGIERCRRRRNVVSITAAGRRTLAALLRKLLT